MTLSFTVKVWISQTSKPKAPMILIISFKSMISYTLGCCLLCGSVFALGCFMSKFCCFSVCRISDYLLEFPVPSILDLKYNISHLKLNFLLFINTLEFLGNMYRYLD